ncbi:MAG: hypothetical protein IPO79_18075 [Flavobacteriales bacterium]|nr:hypothetical protein [Flavobacteriales bacterium]
MGIWNPAILSPDWLIRNAFKVEPNVEVPVTVEFPQTLGSPTKIELEGVSITPSRNRLLIAPLEVSEASLGKVENIAHEILKLLPHTPIRAFGFNFIFSENSPDAESLKIFTSSEDLAQKCDFEFESRSEHVVSTIRFDDRELNLTRSLENGELTIKFNFNYVVSSAEEAISKFGGGNLFGSNLEYAKRILKSIYKVEPAIHGGDNQ